MIPGSIPTKSTLIDALDLATLPKSLGSSTSFRFASSTKGDHTQAQRKSLAGDARFGKKMLQEFQKNDAEFFLKTKYKAEPNGDYYFQPEDKNQKGPLAFHDKDTQLTAASEKPEDAAEAMVALARTKGWTSIQVSGTPEFQKRVIEAARKYGVEVKSPTEEMTTPRAAEQSGESTAPGPQTNTKPPPVTVTDLSSDTPPETDDPQNTIKSSLLGVEKNTEEPIPNELKKKVTFGEDVKIEFDPDEPISTVTRKGLPREVEFDQEKSSATNPFNQISIKLRPLPPLAKKAFPNIVGLNDEHFAVKGPDSKVRRFPIDKGTAYPIREDNRDDVYVGRTLAKQSDVIYDANESMIEQTISEYEFNEKRMDFVYKVNGKPVSNSSKNKCFELYELPNGKWMIPQNELRACTNACEYMLLSEGKSESELDKDQISENLSFGSRRTLEQQVDSLKNKTDQEVVVFETNGMNGRDSVKKLEEMLTQFGPCIFSNGGHARILDAIEKDKDGNNIFSVRDPFSGSCLKIKDNELFWAGAAETAKCDLGIKAADQDKERSWDAIFLKPANSKSETIGDKD